MITAEQATAKWLERIQAATKQITDGVMAVTVAPGAKAAAAADLWATQVAASKDKWKARVSAVSLGDWQQSMIKTGIPRIGQGAQDKQAKTLAFMQKWLPYVNQGAATVHAMPKGGVANGINRAIAQIRYNAAFQR